MLTHDKNDQNRKEIRLNHPVEFMRLTLTYDGPLPSANRSHPRSREKNVIRRYLHPQIEEVFLSHPALGSGAILKDWKDRDPSQRFVNDLNRFAIAFPVEKYCFFPLVTTKHFMYCELDILFLRRQAPGALIHGGDLDNRLKVLLDGLRMPLVASELNGLTDNEPDPFFCLLQEDALVTAINLRTEQWFEPSPPDKSASDVRLVIDVTIRVSRLTYGNINISG